MSVDGKKIMVCYVFRNPGRFFSIERIFRQLESNMRNYVLVKNWFAPSGYAGPISILKNISSVQNTTADVFHVTGDIHYITMGLPRSRTILTIHDCIFLYRSRGLKLLFLKWIFLKWPVRRSKLITTISEATKRDIVKNTGCNPDKIAVIPNPVDEKIFYAPAEFRQNSPIILFIGSTRHKNLERVSLALKGIDCRLHIIGKVDEEGRSWLSNNNITYIQQYNLTDEEIALKYAGSDLVLFPSTFEGFGLPILEGQKAGRPVITSNLSPMKEVAGGAACLVDPYSVASIREGVLKVINDEAYRNQLVQDGFQNVSQYTTENIARQYLECYKRLLTK